MQILIEVSFREEGTKRSGNTKVGFVFSGMQVSGRAFFNVLGSFLIYKKRSARDVPENSEKIVLVITES